MSVEPHLSSGGLRRLKVPRRMYCIETPGNETASLKMSIPSLV